MLKSWTTQISIATAFILVFAITVASPVLIKHENTGLIHVTAQRLANACRDPAWQWIIVFCLLLLLVGIFAIEKYPSSPTLLLFADFSLAIMVLQALFCYALMYDTASRSTQVPTLLAGIVFGRLISQWIHNKPNISLQIERWFVAVICLFTMIALWQPESEQVFQYHEVHRWKGPLESPNLYGLLMGSGLILAAGIGIQNWKNKAYRIFLFFAAIVMAYGLLRSYSRGAWLATAAGCFYVAVQRIRSSSSFSWISHNWSLSLPLALSLMVVVFWGVRESEWLPAQRIVSITNLNDFSWRNRVSAWFGAGRMILDKPTSGFGWGQAEQAYQRKYLSRRPDEAAAIQVNDFLMLGVSAGIPVLACFVIYILFPFYMALGSAFSIFSICRGAIVVF